MFFVVVWFCCSSSLAVLISAYLFNLMHHFLLHWVICFGGYLFVHTSVFFFEKYLNFLCFSVCSSFGRQLCQNCGWAGSEPYVRSHITGPPCYFYICRKAMNFKTKNILNFIALLKPRKIIYKYFLTNLNWFQVL